VNGQVLCEVAHSNARDVEAALDASHAAKDAWGRTSVVERALILRIADRMENHFDLLALWMSQSCRQKRPPCRRA
jgi:aldehyde dehydrogenase